MAALPARKVSCLAASIPQLVIVTASCSTDNARNETSAAGAAVTGQRSLMFGRTVKFF